MADAREMAKDVWSAGVAAVNGYAAVAAQVKLAKGRLMVGGRSFKLKEYENIFVVGSGKASGAMAEAMESILGERLTGGVVVVKYGHLANVKRVELIEAGHPVPDEAGLEGASAIFRLLEGLGKRDLVFCLLSGGGSALLPSPARGVSLEDKQETTRHLLACGATIHEINAIRKHISTLKGGGLMRTAYPAHVVTLILSDVVGDDLDVIASGPTVPDRSTVGESLAVIEKYGLRRSLPTSVIQHLERSARREIHETPKPGDPIFERSFNVILGSNVQALLAAKKKAESLGLNTLVLSSLIQGEARFSARFHAAIAREVVRTGNPASPPACIISGGESTVTIRGEGVGGRNTEFALAFAIAIGEEEGITLISAGTDGTDGPTDAAGAFADSSTLRRAREMGLAPGSFLEQNDSYTFFEKLGDLFKTGPTDTNVMDMRVIIVT